MASFVCLARAVSSHSCPIVDVSVGAHTRRSEKEGSLLNSTLHHARRRGRHGHRSTPIAGPLKDVFRHMVEGIFPANEGTWDGGATVGLREHPAFIVMRRMCALRCPVPRGVAAVKRYDSRGGVLAAFEDIREVKGSPVAPPSGFRRWEDDAQPPQT